MSYGRHRLGKTGLSNSVESDFTFKTRNRGIDQSLILGRER